MDRRWILGGVLFAGGIGVARVLTARPKLKSDSRILLIGDSLAKGLAPHLQALAKDDQLAFLSGAIEGTRVDQWIESDWLQRKLGEEFKPTHVLISLGTNDAYTNFSPDKVRVETAALVEDIRAAGAAPIWIGAPDLPDTSGGRPLNEDILEEIEDVVPYYFDSTDFVIPRGPDNLHPTAAGYAGWAGVLWNWLS